MSIFNFKKQKPCVNGQCKYEYSMTDRDIEGMPFTKSENDPRKCPQYGHVCPHFMKDFGFSVADLNIRATIHCGLIAKDMLESGKWKYEEMGDSASMINDLLVRYESILVKYPQESYPKYYIWEV